MAKSNKDIKNSRGRPKTTGSGQPQLVRMHEKQIAAVDEWRDKHEVSRPEAIRRLVELGLKAKSR
jgi:Ribbon-helix-helix protein, copG family